MINSKSMLRSVFGAIHLVLMVWCMIFTVSSAQAIGKRLSSNEIFQSGSVTCGFLKGRWVPGRLKSGNRFISHTVSRKVALKKARKTSGRTQAKYRRVAYKWKKRRKQQSPICAQGNGVTTPKKRPWTVMVYMAADNSLSLPGLQDIDEMEIGGGTSDDVAVVVQAEFNKEQLAMSGISSPQEFNRPNYNTFRYVVGDTNRRIGPDGSALDIGNRNMADPMELADFITWSKRNYPADHYLLVLWNHGGGFTGLLEDQTSHSMASLQDVRTALMRSGKIDVLDFDMCLMAQYETLNALDGLVDYVVASEENEPGEGNPYDLIIREFHGRWFFLPEAVAYIIVDLFHESYEGSTYSTTKSAIDMRYFRKFDNLLATTGSFLTNNVGELTPDIQDAAKSSQSYSLEHFKDFVDVMGSLGEAAPASRKYINPILTHTTSSLFVLNNRYRTGTSLGSPSVDRSFGFSITLPSLIGEDNFDASGDNSLENYKLQVPNKWWTKFLESYADGSSGGGDFDTGDQRPEWYLIWQEAAIAAGVEIDLAILEPSGNIYMPYLGTITPNGVFTPDSFDSGDPVEGYQFRQRIAGGRYHLLGFLAADPNNYRPEINVLWRVHPNEDFNVVYDFNNLPGLSKDKSIDDVDSVDMTDILNGKYTDFRRFASWCFGDECSKGSVRSRSSDSKVTAEQLKMIAKLGMEARRARTGSLGEYVKSIPHHNESRSGTVNRFGSSYFWNRMKK